MIIAHLNNLWSDLVESGAYDCIYRLFERRFDYAFDCGTLFDRLAARL